MRGRDFTVAENSAITLATHIASYALNFVASIIIARNLGPAGKGTLSLVVLTHRPLQSCWPMGQVQLPLTHAPPTARGRSPRAGGTPR